MLRLFEESVLRNVCGHKRKEVTGDWRVLHNEELPDLLFSPAITCHEISEDNQGRECGTYRDEEKCIQNFGWVTSRKRLLERLRCESEDNIKINVKEKG